MDERGVAVVLRRRRRARQSVMTRNDSILNRSSSRRPSPPPAAARINSSREPSADLEVIAVVLEVLQGLEHPPERRRVHLEAELGGLQLEGRAPGELAHHDAGPVADGVGRHVLIGVRTADEGTRVQARLVGERRRADIGPLRVEGEVDELGDVAGHRGEPLETVRRDRLHPHLQG